MIGWLLLCGLASLAVAAALLVKAGKHAASLERCRAQNCRKDRA